MKAITVSELKANLSRYLRMAARGTRIIVKDRDDPIAQLGPLEQAPETWHERLARAGKLRPGTQAWSGLTITKLERAVDIKSALAAVREDASEIHRR